MILKTKPRKTKILPIQKIKLNSALCFPWRKEIRFNKKASAPEIKKINFAVLFGRMPEPILVKSKTAIKKAITNIPPAIFFRTINQSLVQIRFIKNKTKLS